MSGPELLAPTHCGTQAESPTFAGRWLIPLAVVLLLVIPSALPVCGGEEKPKPSPETKARRDAPPSLLEQDPFDLITLDAANGNQKLKVLPLDGGKRRSPFPLDLKTTYRVRLVERDTREYDISGRNIVRVELYEDLLLNEARRFIEANQFDDAFPYMEMLRTNYAYLPSLDRMINDYLYLDAVSLSRKQRFNEALGNVEELLSRQGDYRYDAASPTPIEFLDGLVDRLVGSLVERKNYRAARLMLQRIAADYSTGKPPAVERWVSQLRQMAVSQREEGQAHLKAERFRDALAAIKEMFAIWPDVEGGRELNAELSRLYPIVVVGVIQPAKTYDARRLDDWGARRTGRLVQRNLVEFLGPGPEGGQYESAVGQIDRSDDRRTLLFRRNPSAAASDAVTGYDVSRRLLELADPHSPDYSPVWSSLLVSATVKDVFGVNVQLCRAHVLPEALLRVPLTSLGSDSKSTSGGGPFHAIQRSSRELSFVSKTFRRGGRLAEIVELTFTDTAPALAALQRGELDAVDRLFPADATKYLGKRGGETPFQVDQYALPTLHLLVPNANRNRFLAHRDFRRALLTAIDRKRILEQELLGGAEVPGCREVSGPFPAGAGDTDPLGYAYDSSIPPHAYDPYLAKLLARIAQNQVAAAAAAGDEPPPKLAPLVLGHPAHEVARVACQAIASHWRAIGLETKLQEFPPGVVADPAGACDLVYAEVAIWEPVVDADRLLGITGPAATENTYVRQALRWLNQAQSWDEVRKRLLELHRAVQSEAAVLPLWQLVDFFSYGKRLRNVGQHPVWLYQKVDEWQLGEVSE